MYLDLASALGKEVKVVKHLAHGQSIREFFKTFYRTIYEIEGCSNSRKTDWEEEHLTYHSADTLYGTDDANHLLFFLPQPGNHK